MQPEKLNKQTPQNGTVNSDSDSVFGDVIYRYTRAQAIEDGVLVDVTETASECGFRLPVALTAGAWAECVAVPPDASGQDEAGRLWDVLNVLRFAAQGRCGASSNRVDFNVLVQQSEGRSKKIDLYALCGPGDNAEPVITIMLTHED